MTSSAIALVVIIDRIGRCTRLANDHLVHHREELCNQQFASSLRASSFARTLSQEAGGNYSSRHVDRNTGAGTPAAPPGWIAAIQVHHLCSSRLRQHKLLVFQGMLISTFSMLSVMSYSSCGR